MSGIQKFFKTKNPNSIQMAFLRQTEEKENVKLQNECTDEQQLLKNKIEILEIENRDLKKKYDNLKSKHVNLLQVLLKLEEKNQLLEMKTKSKGNSDNTHPFNDNESSKSERSSDFFANLVFTFLLNCWFYSHFISCVVRNFHSFHIWCLE